ncbi:MAG: NADH-quinone oxidoreductase subunit L, partial [Verrucomicrobiales bacterium]
VGALVHIFSLGYMAKDESKGRYFGCLSLFMFSMTGIVLADNFAMMFIFWELVGVSSYLLIGHWFTKNAPVEAAKKAFLTNRIGDFGFMIGILMLWGMTGTIVFSDMEAGAISAAASHSKMFGIAVLCLFCGAVGKSAQMPLHVWLPDAMEGPTPVSALIHAATMVAAGVFMLARVSFLLPLTEAAQIIAWVGAITSLFAAVIATQQNDIKKVLAYSTLSQLGYMVMAAGLAQTDAAMFHLYTHAGFKALLFLGAGAVIYACHHEQDMWKMGGLAKKMPITFITFAIGTAALAAVPYITSGFYSKEQILTAAYNGNKIMFYIAGAVAFLTPFYMMRLFTVVFLGKPRTDHADHAKEVPSVMSMPLVILAGVSVIAGFRVVAKMVLGEHYVHEHVPTEVLVVSVGTLIAGAFLGYVMYRGKVRDSNPIGLIRDKFYLDELYIVLVRVFQDGVALIMKAIDTHVVDGIASRGSAKSMIGLGSLFRRIQVGNLQAYAFLFGVGVILIVYLLVFAS